jgi:hypothetical protein
MKSQNLLTFLSFFSATSVVSLLLFYVMQAQEIKELRREIATIKEKVASKE